MKLSIKLLFLLAVLLPLVASRPPLVRRVRAAAADPSKAEEVENKDVEVMDDKSKEILKTNEAFYYYYGYPAYYGYGYPYWYYPYAPGYPVVYV